MTSILSSLPPSSDAATLPADTAMKLFINADLVPEAWWIRPPEPEAVEVRDPDTGEVVEIIVEEQMVDPDAPSSNEGFRVFNPTLIALGDGYAMTYRVVHETQEIRRLASCRLTHDFEIVPGSITPLSDLIRFADEENLNERALQWHADARYLLLDGAIHLIWNDGANRPQNHQFIARMADDGLVPAEPAREITRVRRDSIEKNWMLFNANGGTWAIYGLCPHEVLSVRAEGDRLLLGEDATVSQWNSSYQTLFGELRGSAQPVLVNNRFLTIAHSSYKTRTGRRYRACFYEFAPDAPFDVVAASSEPFELPNPKGTTFDMPRLNKEVEEVVYPCGFAVQGNEVVVSYGINDECCAVARFPLAKVMDSLKPVRRDVTLVGGTALPAALAPLSDEAMPELPPSRLGLPLFWWDALDKLFDGAGGKRRFEVGNFGDIASMEIVQRISGIKPQPPKPGQRKLVSIGSVLHTARNGDVIWGTGVKGTKMGFEKKVTDLSVYAVRGPLTVDFLRRSNIDTSKIAEVFDPGCLIPVLYAREIEAMRAELGGKSRGVRIVPHYRDDLILRRERFDLARQFVTVDCDPLGMIRSLLGAELVISSSLHGIIFAEALGIPAVWLASVGGEDSFKFYDYYYGTGRYAVKPAESIDEAFATKPPQLPKLRFDDYLATFPHEALQSLALPEQIEPGSFQFSAIDEALFPEMMRTAGFDRRDSSGLWMTERSACLETSVPGTRAGDTVELALGLHPYNPAELPVPQRLRLRVNGAVAGEASWLQGSRSQVTFNLSVPAVEGRTPVRLEFEARNARSPKALQLGPINKPLAVCLDSCKLGIRVASVPVPPADAATGRSA